MTPVVAARCPLHECIQLVPGNRADYKFLDHPIVSRNIRVIMLGKSIDALVIRLRGLPVLC
jgi:hypothetical protein